MSEGITPDRLQQLRNKEERTEEEEGELNVLEENATDDRESGSNEDSADTFDNERDIAGYLISRQKLIQNDE